MIFTRSLALTPQQEVDIKNAVEAIVDEKVETVKVIVQKPKKKKTTKKSQ